MDKVDLSQEPKLSGSCADLFLFRFRSSMMGKSASQSVSRIFWPISATGELERPSEEHKESEHVR